MAQKVNVLFVDDTDGSEATAGTVRFGLDGTGYEIDLSQENAEVLRAGVRRFVEHARPVRTRVRGSGPIVAQDTGHRSDNAECRAWLNANGYEGEVKKQGRIPAELRDKHERRIPKIPADATRRTGADVDAVADSIANPEPSPAEPAPVGESVTDQYLAANPETADARTAVPTTEAATAKPTPKATATEKPARQRKTTTTGKAKTGEMG